MFPIILTELRSYPQFVKDNFKLTHFTKYDLDAAQCLGMIVFILNHLLASLIEKTSTGRISQESVDLIQLMELSKFYRLNYVEMYILTKRLHWLADHTSSFQKAFFTKLRKCRNLASEELSLTENSAASRLSQTLSYLESIQKDPQEQGEKRDYLLDYLTVRSEVTVSNVELAVNNFYKFVLLSQMYKGCNSKSKEKKLRIQAYESRLLASKTYKRADKTFYMINLHMHINMGVLAVLLESR